MRIQGTGYSILLFIGMTTLVTLFVALLFVGAPTVHHWMKKPATIEQQPAEVKQTEVEKLYQTWRDGDEVIVRYATFQHRPVELVVDNQTRRVILRVKLADDYLHGHLQRMYGENYEAADLDYLKSEVVHIASAGQPMKIGESEISFHFTGGYPIWGPHTEYLASDGQYQALMFAENTTLRNAVITAQGRDQKIGHYPYPCI